MTHASLNFDTRLTPSLTPRLQYAVRLLQLSALDYEQELLEVSARNPFLEWSDPGSPRESALVAEADAPDADAARSSSPLEDDPRATRDDAATDDWAGEPSEHDSWSQLPGAARDGAREPRGSALDTMEAGTDLRQHLRLQANLLTISARDHALVCTVIESLDDDGYLRIDEAEIAAFTALQPPADACEINTAIRLVQSFDPAGVGARSVSECLLLQLDHIDVSQRPLARAIVTDHLDRLAQRDVAAMARLLGRTPDDIEAACSALRRLDPRPGWRFARPDAHFVAPDVIVRKVRGQWVAQLNAAVVPRLRLNRGCAELLGRHRGAPHAAMNTHLKDARWTLRNVEQRCATILCVAQAILRRQHGFFEHGPLAMKPLALRDIAAEVGVHESTVCRVTNNKFMSTAAGVFELKRFFSRPMAMSGGGACSPTAIRGVLKELVAAEDAGRPLSDAELAQRLERQGLKVARRTVTKYRQMLRIAPADRRRTHGAIAA